MIFESISDLVGDGAYVATIGLPTDEISTQAGVIDLDTHQVWNAPKTTEALAVIAQTYTDLRRGTSLITLLPTTKRLLLIILDPPRDRPLPLPHVSPHIDALRRVQAYLRPSGEWVIDARFTRHVAARAILTTVVRSPHEQALQVQRVALSGNRAADWRPGDTWCVPATKIASGHDLEALSADIALRLSSVGANQHADPIVSIVDRLSPDELTWLSLSQPGAVSAAFRPDNSILDPSAVPPIDLQSINPIGFLSNPDPEIVTLAQDGAHWAFRSRRMAPMPVHPSGLITDVQVSMLRHARAVRVEWGRHTGPLTAVRTIACLAAAGIPILAPHIPMWALSLGKELIAQIMSFDSERMMDDIDREVYSIRLRRAAFQAHSTGARWREFAARAGHWTPTQTVSVLLCTKRPEQVAFAVEQISRQRHVEIELVLALHGIAAHDPRIRSAIDGFAKPLKVVEVPADVALGEALNRGASAASGQFLAKWDDDDWYGPEHIADLLMAAEYSSAEVVGCPLLQVYLEELDTTIYRPRGEAERFNQRICGGSLLISRNAFSDVGGFRPIGRGEDTGLLSAVRAAGGTYYRTHGLGYLMHRRRSGHSWEFSANQFVSKARYVWPGFKPNELVDAPIPQQNRTLQT